MEKTDLREAAAACARASAVLDAVQEDLLAWADRKAKVLEDYQRDLRRLQEVARELPANWHAATASQVAAGEVLGKPAILRRYLIYAQERLGEEERRLLRRFEREPWFYTIFLVERPIEGEFYRVRDHGAGDALLLYSPALTKLHRQGASLFFTLFFYNGLCYQTFGPLHYYRGFHPFDFAYLAKAVRPDLYRTCLLYTSDAADE